MIQIDKRVREALREAGAILVREKGHYVFRLPNGKMIVVGKSLSDYRAVRNVLGDIRQAQRQEVGK